MKNQIETYEEYIKAAYSKELKNGKDFDEISKRPEAKKYWENLKKEYDAENKIKDNKNIFIENAVNKLGKDKFMTAFSNKKKAEKVINGECGFNSIEKDEIEYLLSINN